MGSSHTKRLSRAVQAAHVVNIDDLRLLAKRRLPRAVFDYIDGGAERELTLRENCRAFDAVRSPRARYWRIIYPGSAIIRRVWLDAIASRAAQRG